MAEFFDGVSRRTPRIEDKRHKDSIFVAAANFRREKAFTDVVISIKTTEFAAHRLILAGSSPVLKAMLTADMKEKSEGRINLSDSGIAVDILEQLLEYMYTGTINVRMENVEGLLSSSSYLLMNGLHRFCCDFLETILCPNNCLGIQEIAIKYSCDNLIEKIEKMVCDEFLTICNGEEFLLLSEERFAEILKKDSIEVGSEDDVLEALYKWVHYHPLVRSNSFQKLTKFIRLQFLSEEALNSLIHERNYLTDVEVFHVLMKEVLQAKQARENGELLQVGLYIKPRNCMNKCKVVFSCGGYDGAKCLQTCFGFIPGDERLCQLQAMKVARQDHAIAELDDRVYAIGGFSSHQGPLDSIECYNPRKNQWTTMSSMNTKRKSLGVTTLNGKLYATGGLDENYSLLNTTEYFDPDVNMWQNSDNMNEARYSHCLVSDNEHMYAVGGWQLSSLERYSPQESRWENLAGMSSTRAGATAELMNGRIYVSGGYGNDGCLNSNEFYDIQSNEWTPIAQASVSRWRASSCIIGDKLYIIGGRDSNWQYLDCIESFDVIDKDWESHGCLFSKIMGLKCCTLEVPVQLFK